MNKSRRRAVQKHRAARLKFEMRRKAIGEQGGAKSRTATSGGGAAATASRQKEETRRPAPRRREGAELGE